MYGLGTRSYNRSTEARQNKLAQKEATAKYQRGEMGIREVEVGPICVCRSFNLPHEVSRHTELASDLDWRTESARRGISRWKEPIR